MKNPTRFVKTLLPALVACCVVSARAEVFSYTVSLSPVSVGASGSGTGTVNYDSVTHLLTLQADWSGLSGNTTASHIHLPTATPFTGTAGVVITPTTLVGFPTGVTSGSYSNTFNLTLASTYPAAFITANGGTTAGAEAAVAAAFAEGRAYWNIHTTTFGAGEINGFLVAVPEPSSLALSGLGIAAVATQAWRRKRVG